MALFKCHFCLFFALKRPIKAGLSNSLLGALTVGALLSSTVSAANVYYVSAQNGNDSWSGLLASPNSSNSDGPFKSLARAQSAMQGSSIHTVNVRAGTYSIASSFQLYPADSGETWISYSGESPILDGGGTGQMIVNNPTNITIEGFTFQNMGAGGLHINFGNALTLRWNTFYNCNQNCISGSGAVNSTIDSNTINGQSPGNPPGLTTEAAYSAITLGYGSSNNKLTHNLIENCQGGGIAFGDGPTDPPISNNIVDRNIFKNVDTNVVDMGAIYFYDTSHAGVGNQITNNIVNGNAGSGSLTKAYYLDGYASNVLVSGNICRNCGDWGWQIHAGDHNTIVNNIFDISAQKQVGIYQTQNSNYAGGDFGMAGNIFETNLIYFEGAVPSDLYQVNILASDALPTDQDNLYYSVNGSSIPNGQDIVDSSPVYANPEFAEPSAGNYSMPASSPAYTTVGFQSLPTDQGPVSGNPSTGPSSPAGSGSLTGSGNSATTTANLTTEGPTDWAHWGTTSLTRMSGVTPQIGPWSIVGSGQAIYYVNDHRAVTFTNGTVPTAATVTDGIYVNGQNGFSFTAPAGTSAHTLTVHVGSFNSGGTLRAHLSDGSAADFVDTTSTVSGSNDRNYTLSYQAASAGQTLTISWVCNSATGNVTLNGAALR